MIQCKDCEFCQIAPDGTKRFSCDPFSNIKEPECIAKWQLMRLDMLLASYQGMLQAQKRMEPLQDKMFKYVEREVDDMNEADKWKLDEQNEDSEDEDEGDFGNLL